MPTFDSTFRDWLLQCGAMESHAPDTAAPCFTGEFWTAKQRAAHSLHEVSYRACFKAQLPRFFIDRLSAPGACVYDPFMGRGTTVLEAALAGRVARGVDVNPIGCALVTPRLTPPSYEEVETRLRSLNLFEHADAPDELLVFYHPETLREIAALRGYLQKRQEEKSFDTVDGWIKMVTMNRLTGHSKGFLSVYTLPPNQATSVKAQQRINEKRKQTPPRRELAPIVLKKTRSLLRHVQGQSAKQLSQWGPKAQVWEGDASNAGALQSNSVDLVVTSPPFLDVVDYAGDNWLRGWFAGVDTSSLKMAVVHSVAQWERTMLRVFEELSRIVKPGGYIAFEVGEVRKGSVRLEEAVCRVAQKAGLNVLLILVNQQDFTKTAQCWGVDNNKGGTNSNRVVLIQKG